MPSIKLTDRFCRTAEPGDWFDTVVPGLRFRVSTRARSFALIYTRPGTRRRAYARIGSYLVIGLADARRAARDLQMRIAEGEDPAAEKRAERQAMRVRDLVENYVARHASTKRTGARIAYRLRKEVTGRIGEVKLSDLHRRDLTRCIDRVMDRGSPVQANRVFEDIRAMVRWGHSRGDLDVNIAEGLRRPAESKIRERVLDAGEIATLWTALPSAPMSAPLCRIIRLCLLTGQRVGEVAGMRADELDLAERLWTMTLPERTKNGRPHSVPLSGMALEIIREQIAEAGEGQFTFPGTRTGRAIGSDAVAMAVHRARPALGIEHWTAHDLRRTMATHLEGMGVSPLVLGHVLNHSTVTRGSITSQVYARYDYAREKREALELWADRLQAIVGGEAPAEVVPLRA